MDVVVSTDIPVGGGQERRGGEVGDQAETGQGPVPQDAQQRSLKQNLNKFRFQSRRVAS